MEFIPRKAFLLILEQVGHAPKWSITLYNVPTFSQEKNLANIF